MVEGRGEGGRGSARGGSRRRIGRWRGFGGLLLGRQR